MSPIRRLAGLLMAVSLVLAACGSNKATESPGGGGAGASQAPAGSQAAGPSGSASAGGSAAASGGAGASAGAGPSGSGGGAVSDLSGELTVWAMGNEGTMLKPVVDAFNKQYPNVKVSVTPVDWGQADAKLQTAIGGGQTPDVSQMGTDMMAKFAGTGALEEVGSNFSSGDFFESAWNTNVVNGKTYGVPWYVETRALYYRTDIAEKAGITEAPGSWDDLKAAAKAMKEKGGAQAGIALGTKNAQEWLPFLWSNGGNIMSDDGTFTLDSAESVESLKFYDSFFEEGLSPKSVPEGFDITPAFVAGSHPMTFSGPWHIGLFNSAGGEGKWAVAPMPGKDGPPGTSWLGGSNMVVFKDSQNKDAAWAWVEFVSRPETQVLWYETATVLPAVEEAWSDPKLADDENFSVFGDQLKEATAPPAVQTWAEISTAINDNLEKMTTGNTSPEDAAKAMQEAASGIGTGG
jgi:multiple sugar transport system substrate-binding protein